jgi:hypothetical protein
MLNAEGGTRTPTSYLTRPSNVRVYQFRHFGSVGPLRVGQVGPIILLVQ